jgi:hypothetical protein
VDGQQDLIDFTFATFLIDLRAGGDAFQPVAAVIKSMASLSTSVLIKKTKTTIHAAYSGAQGFSPVLQQQHWHQKQQQQGDPHGGLTRFKTTVPPQASETAAAAVDVIDVASSSHSS